MLAVEPDNGLAHAALGLLLLGTGARNFAAINACGLNQHEAMQHLQRAVQLNPEIVRAQEALDFCREELESVEEWRRRVAALKARPKGGSGKVESEAGCEQTTPTPTPTPPSSGSHMEARRYPRDGDFLVGTVPRVVLRTVASLLRLVSPILPLTHLGRCVAGVVCTGLKVVSENSASVFPTLVSSVKGFCVRHAQAQAQVAEQSQVSEVASTNMLRRWERRAASIAAIPELHRAPTSQSFMFDYVLRNKPVVVRNGEFQQHWRRNVTRPGQAGTYPTFSSAHLTDVFGDAIVRVSVSESGRFDGPESGPAWGLAPDVDVLVRPPLTSMRLADFFALMQKTDMEGSGETCIPETFYIEYLALHQYLGAGMEELIPLPDAANTDMLEPLVTNLWIGNKPTTSPLHYDDYENLLCQIWGRKELILYPPSDLTSLYYVGRPKGKLTYGYPSKFTRDPATVDQGSFVFGSSVNLDAPDMRRHPKFKNASPIRVVLEPGDVIYLPAYWHHEVQSIPDDDGLNVAVNFWFKNATFPIDDMAQLNMH